MSNAPNMERHIREYVQGYDVCQRSKNLQRHPAGKPVPWPVPTKAPEVVSMDRVTHLLKTEKGHTAISVVVDKFTKICLCAPCKSMMMLQQLQCYLRTTASG